MPHPAPSRAPRPISASSASLPLLPSCAPAGTPLRQPPGPQRLSPGLGDPGAAEAAGLRGPARWGHAVPRQGARGRFPIPAPRCALAPRATRSRLPRSPSAPFSPLGAPGLPLSPPAASRLPSARCSRARGCPPKFGAGPGGPWGAGGRARGAQTRIASVRWRVSRGLRGLRRAGRGWAGFVFQKNWISGTES